MNTPDLAALESLLLAQIKASPAGLSEHVLLKRLRIECPEFFPQRLFNDSLALYRAHFLLFHVLHRMREALLADQEGILVIDVLSIRLLPYRPADTTAVSIPDPMAAYYLDLGNMEQTSAQDVDHLLGNFWAHYYANNQRADALTVLGLSDPVSMDEIQQRYRQLAMAHHPDRDGDTEQFQALQQAVAVLRKC